MISTAEHWRRLSVGAQVAGDEWAVRYLDEHFCHRLGLNCSNPNHDTLEAEVADLRAYAIAIEARKRTDPEEGLDPKGKSAGLAEASPESRPKDIGQ